jgi:ribosome-dependent ATPase
LDVADAMPESLSLGMRQRLQLAAACLHEPEVLILDEPTSGVDPAARDMFWTHLVHLSRHKRVTIFVSTHFMNEAERCDRISFMHRGRVLAVGTPKTLQENQSADTLEAAFIDYLQEEIDREPDQIPPKKAADSQITRPALASFGQSGIFAWLKMVASFTEREAKELLRDKIRLAFAIIGPIVLLITAALNVSFDVENVKFTYLDRDQSVLSRQFIEEFSGSRYFKAMPALADQSQINPILQGADVKLVIEIPPGFGADLLGHRQPEVAFYIDGAQPFTAENIRGFVTGIMLQYTQNVVKQSGLPMSQASLPANLEPRFVYNQSFKSIYAITPGILMLALILIPTMLTALGVVREKEIGSIVNLYASPASTAQYLIGNQLPYVLLGFLSYLSLVFLCVFALGVPVKGSFWAMSLGALLFIMCATGLGLLISTFVKSQVAALFGSAIICLIPSINFSGLLYPVSTLTGSGLLVGLGFPSSWFQLISLGAFTKALGFASFTSMYLALTTFAVVYLLLACLLLKKQEL